MTGALLAQVGVTAVGHSQSAGSIGVRVQVTSMEPARAAWAAAAEVFALRGAESATLQARQPGPGQPVLVVIDSIRDKTRSRPGGVADRTRVSIVFP
ncbi:MAG TPA: hypothetical protein VFS94_11270 [Gemmatimonadales bacterium]|nr:hypothetical protein [Gemmatimonadales bacterium]